MKLRNRLANSLVIAFVTLSIGSTKAWPADTTGDDTGVWSVLPTASEAAREWRYATVAPPETWIQSDFDDAQWKRGPAGFGTADTPNTHVRTEWNTESIWLRTAFELNDPLTEELYFTVQHDEDTEIYLNGVKAASLTRWNQEYELVAIAPEAVKALRTGKNAIAVHCQQTTGGQYVDVGVIRPQTRRWTRERAWTWYRHQPWLCGYNYVPANAISYTEMFMDYCFDGQRIDRELALSQEIGFNCARIVLPFVVWEHDPAAFKKRLDALLTICQRRGMRLMPAQFDDCGFGPVSDPIYGRQPEVVVGWYANGWTPSPGHTIGRSVAQWPRLKRYVQDIIGTFRDDPRILAWDLYNEPTNGTSNLSMALVDRVFDWARESRPTQPVTVGIWCDNAALNQLCLLRSDIVTFHNYSPPEVLAAQIADLQSFGRPVICSEWLNRPLNSTVAGCLPVFQRTGVGCFHWGLVNGKTQTHLAWGWRPGRGEPEKWQHDLFHDDYRPYDAAELRQFSSAIARNKTAPDPGQDGAGEKTLPAR